MKKITIQDIKKLKNVSHPFATLTAYDCTSAQILNEAEKAVQSMLLWGNFNALINEKRVEILWSRLVVTQF